MIDIFSPPSMLDEVLFDITHHRLPGPVSMHSHSCVEIVVVVSGSAVQEVGGIRRKVYGGVTTIINPGCAHMFDEVHDLELYNVSCSANLFEQFGGGMIFLKGREELFSSRHPFSLFLLPGLVFCDIRHLLELMFEKYAEDESPKRQPLLRSLFSFFLVLLIQSYRPEVNTGRLSIEELAAFLDAEYARAITLKDLAGKTGMSVNTLLKKFRSRIGASPIQYLLDVRMKHAKEMLDDPRFSVKQIAEACGFYDSNYFIKLYRKRFGHSPRARQGREDTSVSVAPATPKI